jgi:hypothetical protein
LLIRIAGDGGLRLAYDDFGLESELATPHEAEYKRNMYYLSEYSVIETGFIGRRRQFNHKVVQCAVALIRAGKEIGIQARKGMTSQSYRDLDEGITRCLQERLVFCI